MKEYKSLKKESYSIKKIGIFGSYARGEATENSDIDIIAAKYAQIYKVSSDAVLFMMNEDDLFNLVHEDDKQLYNTDTGDPKQDKINYGRARAEVLVNIF